MLNTVRIVDSSQEKEIRLDLDFENGLIEKMIAFMNQCDDWGEVEIPKPLTEGTSFHNNEQQKSFMETMELPFLCDLLKVDLNCDHLFFILVGKLHGV